MGDSGAYVLEGSQTIREGERRIPVVSWIDFDTVSTGGTELFVNGSTDSANWLSGTSVVSGNTLTCPTVTIPAGFGGITAVLEAAVISNSQTWKVGIVFNVLKPGAQR